MWVLKQSSPTSSLWPCRDFEHNANVAAARSLMQQGLRMCKQDEAMWAEYFRLELLYVHRLRQRRKVLGLDLPAEDLRGLRNPM